MAKLQPDVFLDVNSNYEPSAQELVSNLRAINNSIFNILGTPLGSRSFRPTYGSNLLDFIHEPMDEATSVRIRDAVIVALSEWEPRINVNFHNSRVEPINSGGFTVTISYSVPDFSVSSSTSISFAG